MAELDLDEMRDAEAALCELMDDLAALPAEERHETLSEWARSPLWDPLLMMLQGEHGRIARAAWAALRTDLASDTPGRRWDAIPHALGRASIERLLGVQDDPNRVYAGIAFRTWIDDDERSWIAGAIGACPVFDTDATMRWTHLEIRDVILWDPRTNEVRLVGEHHSQAMFVMPTYPEPRLKVWADGAAFFRAWARKRANKVHVWRSSKGGHPAPEYPGADLPGALLVGDIRHARWPGDAGAATVVAGPGITAAELQWAAIRAANLPIFEGGASARGN